MACTTVSAFYFYSPLHDPFLLPHFSQDKKSLFVIGAGGIDHARAYSSKGESTSALRLWESSQSSINMLNGSASNSAIGQLAATVDATDDGTRGHIALNGNFKIDYGFLYGAYIPFAHNWSLLFMLPQYHTKLHEVSMQDLTQPNTAEDIRVQKLLTNQINTILQEYGSGLTTQAWSATGLGDLACYVQWQQIFAQQKPFLKEVGLLLRTGLMLPTAKKDSLGHLLKFSFGNNGSCALPIGAQLTLQLGDYFNIGMDAELTHIFDKNGKYRIKTAPNQTELFLLQVIKAHRDFGMNQRFELFFKALHPKGVEVRLAYQYFKHGDDELTACAAHFNNTIINSAHSLYQTTAHHIIAVAECNLSRIVGKQWTVEPIMNLFAKIPFNGSNTLLTPLIGGSLSIQF